MNLSPIPLEPDSSNPLYQSENCQALICIYDEYYPQNGYEPPWTGYFIIKDNEVVGSCGFTKAPVDGVVEIAYWTFPEYEGQGIASFACGELIRMANEADPTVKVIAKTAPDENPSVTILKKYHFSQVGIVQDEEIGDAWLWERKQSLVNSR
jgi:[ribosomal protein S5]-alanine N-acetyltransferase